MEDGDDWLGADKLEHLVACFFIALVVAALCGRSRYPVLRRWSSALGVLVALAAGAFKEAGDEIGLWRSAGASVKDAVADVLGAILAALLLAASRRFVPSRLELEMIGEGSPV